MGQRSTVAIFGSSRPAAGSLQYRQAFELGQLLGRAGFAIANGGYGGTMEAAAHGVKEAGGATIGVTCDAFGSRSANAWIDNEIRTADLDDRLMKLIELGQAYVILPGSTGTLLELAMCWELMNKKFIPQRPMICLCQYWKPVVEAVCVGGEATAGWFQFAREPAEIVRLLENHFTDSD